jgi:type III secretion protein C
MASEMRETTYRSDLRRVAGGVAFALLLGAPAAIAAPPPWVGKTYAYVVVDQDVRGVLTEFGRNLGVPVVLTDKVRGRVRGELRAETADDFLKKISEAQDLTWYFDGSALHVSSDEEYSTEIIDAGVDGKALSRELDRLDLADARFAVRSTAGSGIVRVSGPPAFVAVVRETAERLKPPPRVAGDDPRVRVFRGGVKDEVVRTEAPRRASANPEAGGDAGRTP